MIVTRFAPSPTGPLHLGHVYSLLYSYNYSKVNAINVAYSPKAYQRVTKSSKRKKETKKFLI